MVQRKVPSKLGIQAEHVKSDKVLANLKLSSSQHHDGKTRGADMKKKMKKSRSIKLSDLEALQSSPASRRRLSQPEKPPPPLHVPTTSASASATPSPQKQHNLMRITNGSPNYMKPTSSSHAKKELFPVSLRNTQSGSDFKNKPRKFSSDSKATCVSSKKPAKTLTRSSSLSLVRTLTKTTSFKASRICPKKSTRAALCADMNAAPHKATCSSTLKDSKFPEYLMLNPGGTESEGTSVMKVCSYSYCSLNGHHHHADLPPLKSFMASRRRLLKTQKRVKLEALSPRRLKVPCETKKEDSDIEQNFFDAKPAYDEIGMDIFIEIYANEKNAQATEEMGKVDFLKEIEDQEDIKSTIEDKGVMEFIPSIIDAPSPPESKIDLEEDLKKSFDDVAGEVDNKGSFLQEQNAEEEDEDHQTSWSHEEMSMGSYCSDEEHMDDSDSKADDMEIEEEEFYGFDHEEDADSPVYSEEDPDSKFESLSENSHDVEFYGFDHEEDADSPVYSEEDPDSKFESLSENSHDVSVTWLDDILSNYYEEILVDETLKEAKLEESTNFEEQSHGISSVLEDTSGSTETQETCHPSSDMGCDQSSLTEEMFEYLTNAEDNGGENEKHADDEASCNMKAFDEDTIDNSQCQKMSEICKVDETSEDRCSSQKNNDDNSHSEENQIHLFDVPEESIKAVQDQELLEKDQGKGGKFQRRSCIGGEEQNTSENWKLTIRRKRQVEDDDDEMRKFNPKEPNFLPLVPEPEPQKVDLRHQMMDERKNAEEWMLDSALRQVVTKLAPARKKKVALLVEAFETVMPPKCETHLRNNSAYAHARHIQACS